jgi:3-hydroxyacyl-[acyl-carrier-protein] dehydratase
MAFSLDCEQLKAYQPNRFPFLMIDVVTEVEPGQYAKGYKNLTNNEWYFPMHFPGAPNMPGALQLEAMAQMLTVAITTQEGLKGKVTHALEHTVRFRKEVRPGDQLVLEATIDSWRRGVCKGRGVGYTNGEIACEAKMMITIPDIFEQFLPKK